MIAGWEQEIEALAPVVGDVEWTRHRGDAILCRALGLEVRKAGFGGYRVFVDSFEHGAFDNADLVRVVRALLAAAEAFRVAMDGAQ